MIIGYMYIFRKVTTVSIVKIITSHSYKLFFSCDEIYSLSNFKIYGTELLTLVTPLYIKLLLRWFKLTNSSLGS